MSAQPARRPRRRPARRNVPRFEAERTGSTSTTTRQDGRAALRSRRVDAASWKIDVRIWRIVSSMSGHDRPSRSAVLGVAQPAADALHGEPGGEQPLDHVVVQIARDPVAILEQHHPLLSARASASSSATAAWLANVVAMSRSASSNRCRPRSRPTTSAPRVSTVPTSGSTMTGPTGSTSDRCDVVRIVCVDRRGPDARCSRPAPAGCSRSGS